MPSAIDTTDARDGEPLCVLRVHLTDRVEIGTARVDLMERGQRVSGTIAI